MGLDAAGLMAVSSLAGGAAGLGGSISQAQAIRAQGAYQKSVGLQNARMSELSAQQSLERGQLLAASQGIRTGKILGAERAAYANQGVDVNSGSAAQVQADTSKMGALDRLTIQNNAARQALGYRIQGVNDRYGAIFAGMEARNRAESTILTGGMNFARSAAVAAYAERGLFQDSATPRYQGGIRIGDGESSGESNFS